MLTTIRLETLRSYGVDQGLLDALGDETEAERELKQQARRWAGEFDANSLIALRKTLVGHDISPRLAAIEAPLLYVLCRTDSLFPPAMAPPAMAQFREVGVEASQRLIIHHALPERSGPRHGSPVCNSTVLSAE